VVKAAVPVAPAAVAKVVAVKAEAKVVLRANVHVAQLANDRSR
jgi:hypothetical protein